MAQVYAELLPNLHQLAIAVDLPTLSTTSTSVSVDSDSLLTVQHQHEDEAQRISLRLPAKLNKKHRFAIPEAQPQLAFRIPIANAAARPPFYETSNNVPYNAPEMAGAIDVYCRYCRTVFLTSKNVHTWKDLPNENWAELMELWHCHKPSVPDTPDAMKGSKTYVEATRAVAQRGVGFIETSFFLFARENCVGIKDSLVERENDPFTLHCENCDAIVGSIDSLAQGWQIYKWAIGVSFATTNQPQLYDIEKFVSAQILSLVDGAVLRKYSIICSDASVKPFILWVFNPDICYSSSRFAEVPARAMRVLYKSPGADVGDIEKIVLPRSVFSVVLETLRSRNGMMPKGEQSSFGWSVSLLNRFD